MPKIRNTSGTRHHSGSALEKSPTTTRVVVNGSAAFPPRLFLPVMVALLHTSDTLMQGSDAPVFPPINGEGLGVECRKAQREYLDSGSDRDSARFASLRADAKAKFLAVLGEVSGF